MEQELSGLSELGIESIVIVRGTPYWAQKIKGATCGPIKEEKVIVFSQFMYELVERLSAPPYNVKYWELGNEPDVDAVLFVGSNAPYGCWGDAEDEYYGGGYYAEMLKSVSPAIKAADSHAKVLLGGLLLDCDPTNPPENTDCKPVKFLEGVLRNGGGQYFDIVSFHGYPAYIDERITDEVALSWDKRGGIVLGKADYLREILNTYGVEKPLYHTEGALICPEWNPKDCNPPGEDFYDKQANYVVWMFVRNWATGISGTIWYMFEGQGWRYGGLLGSDVNNPKPAYRAFQFLTKILSGATFIRRVEDFPGFNVYDFVNLEQEIWVVWTPDEQPRLFVLPENTSYV